MSSSSSDKIPRKSYLNNHFKRWVTQVHREWGLQFFLEALRETEPIDQASYYTSLKNKEFEKVLEKVWKEISF